MSRRAARRGFPSPASPGGAPKMRVRITDVEGRRAWMGGGKVGGIGVRPGVCAEDSLGQVELVSVKDRFGEAGTAFRIAMMPQGRQAQFGETAGRETFHSSTPPLRTILSELPSVESWFDGNRPVPFHPFNPQFVEARPAAHLRFLPVNHATLGMRDVIAISYVK